MENINIWEEIHACPTDAALSLLLRNAYSDNGKVKMLRKIIINIRREIIHPHIITLYTYSPFFRTIYSKNEFINKALATSGLISHEFGIKLIYGDGQDSNIRMAILIDLFSNPSIFEQFDKFEGVYVNNLVSKIKETAIALFTLKILAEKLICHIEHNAPEFIYLYQFVNLIFELKLISWISHDNCRLFYKITTSKDRTLSFAYPDRKAYILNKLNKIIEIL